MKNLLLLTFALLATVALNAQDIIYTTDGETIESKVSEVGKKEIRYKKFSNPQGPNYSIELSRVERVVYENGSIDKFNTVQEKKSSPFSYSPSELGNNHLLINVVDIMFQNVTIGYEHIFGDERKVGLRVPVSFSLYGNSNNDITFNSYNVFYSGLDLNFYPFGQRQASFYIGPSLRYGYSRFYYTDYQDDLYYYSTNITTDSYGSFLFNGGFTWNPVKELTLTSSLGVGSKRYFNKSPNNRNTVTTASFWFAFGYRF
ncbi:MAG: hypothetical protein R2850_08575 [Bacteroidia bacterium]